MKSFNLCMEAGTLKIHNTAVRALKGFPGAARPPRAEGHWQGSGLPTIQLLYDRQKVLKQVLKLLNSPFEYYKRRLIF